MSAASIPTQSIHAGVGMSQQKDTAAAAAEAVAAALAQLRTAAPAASPRLALLFTTSRHDAAVLHAAVASILGGAVSIVGGFAVGAITRDQLAYDGWQVAVALLSGDDLAFQLATAQNLPSREFAVGQELAAQLNTLSVTADDSLLLFYDTVKTQDGKPALNMATPILGGLASATTLPARLAGMGTIGDMQLHPTHQFAGNAVLSSAAIALLLKAPLRMDTVIMHGCRPAGRYYEITKTDGPVVLEIDHKPALEVIGDMLGPDAGLSWEDYAFFITLGLNRGDPFGPYHEENYANRMCIGIDSARKGLVMFENDLAAGMKVQLMRRSVETSYIPQRVNDLMALAAGRRPVLAFYIDCAGRAAAYCGADEEEAVEVQKALPPGLPLLGVYSGVEIARVAGHPQALDWTGVLCLLSV
jgi:hypothetical protein